MAVKSKAGQVDQAALDRATLAEIKQRKVEALAKLARYRDTHVLETAVPHPRQQLYFDALQDPEIRTLILLGGNRSGKTWAATASAVSLALGRYPWIPTPSPLPAPTKTLVNEAGIDIEYSGQGVLHFPDTRAHKAWVKEQERDKGKLRFDPPIRIRLLGEDMGALEKVHVPKLKSLIAPEWLSATKKNSFGVTTHWIFSNGSTIDLLTYQQESEAQEGWDGHVVIFDEPPPRSHYIANTRGLIDHNGIAIFSMTPLKEAWINDELVSKPDNSVWTLVMDTRENPHLSAKAIEDFESKLTDEERETRLHGKFLHLQGLVFKDFDKKIHVRNCRDVPRDFTVYVSIDTHPRTPQALVFMAVDRRGNMFVVKEIFKHGTPDEVADWIIDFNKDHPIETAVIDPSSKGDSNRGRSTFEIIEDRLSDVQIRLELGSKDLSGGILQFQDALKSRNGVASLFVDPSCERWVWEITRYIWRDWKNAGSQDKGELNKPKDADDHLLECTRRLIQLPAEWVEPRRLNSFKNTWHPVDPETGY